VHARAGEREARGAGLDERRRADARFRDDISRIADDERVAAADNSAVARDGVAKNVGTAVAERVVAEVAGDGVMACAITCTAEARGACQGQGIYVCAECPVDGGADKRCRFSVCFSDGVV